MKLKLSCNSEITLLFTHIGKSYPRPEFFTSQICLLTLFSKISKFTVHVPLTEWLTHFILDVSFQLREEDLRKNLSLISKWKEIKSLTDKIGDLKDKLGDLDVAHLERERRRLKKQMEEFDRDVCYLYIFILR